MKIEYHEYREGRVTTAQYVGPCGSPMAASFTGWLQPEQVVKQLEWNRANDRNK